MSLTTTTVAPAEASAPTTTTVTCDAPGCRASAPVAESGHLPAGWHTLVKALGAAVDAPQWHFHSLECALAHLAGPLGLDLKTIEGHVNPGHVNVGDLVIPAAVRAQFGEVEGDVASMWRAVIAHAEDMLAHLSPSSAPTAAAPTPASPPAEPAPAVEASEATSEAEAEPAAESESSEA